MRPIQTTQTVHTTRTVPARRSLASTVLATGLLAATLGLIAGCDESDASSLRITINPDFSGSLIASSVQAPATPGPAESASGGITWTARGSITMASGAFADLARVELADLKFEYGGAGTSPFLKVTLPRGPKVTWPAALAIPSAETRDAVAKALDPRAAASTVGKSVKIEITVPTKVVTAGLSGRARGLASAFDEKVATLSVPMEVALADGPALVWHVTWEGGK